MKTKSKRPEASAKLCLCERGNGLVEMLLFTPLAILFLFVVLDAGLALKDRSAVTEAVRSGLNAHPVFLQRSNIGNDKAAFEETNASALLEGLAREICSKILRSRAGVNRAIPQNLAVRIGLVHLEIETETGRLLGYSVARLLEYPPGSTSSFMQGGTEKNLLSLEDYVRDALAPDYDRLNSAYAFPLRASTGLQYAPSSYLLAAEVNVGAAGLTSKISSSLLGRGYTFQELQMVPLRIKSS